MLQVAQPKKVLVEQSPVQEFAGKMFIPGMARIKPTDGTVKAIGSQVRQVSIGDKVLVDWQRGAETFTHGEKNYWLLPEKQVIARIE